MLFRSAVAPDHLEGISESGFGDTCCNSETYLAKAWPLAETVRRQVLAVASVLAVAGVLVLVVDALPLLAVVRAGRRVLRVLLREVRGLELLVLCSLERGALSLHLLALEALLLRLDVLLLLRLHVPDVLKRLWRLRVHVREPRWSGLARRRGRERRAVLVPVRLAGVRPAAVMRLRWDHLGGKERDLDWRCWWGDLALYERKDRSVGEVVREVRAETDCRCQVCRTRRRPVDRTPLHPSWPLHPCRRNLRRTRCGTASARSGC
mgnify:CR=1 FL=1